MKTRTDTDELEALRNRHAVLVERVRDGDGKVAADELAAVEAELRRAELRADGAPERARRAAAAAAADAAASVAATAVPELHDKAARLLALADKGAEVHAELIEAERDYRAAVVETHRRLSAIRPLPEGVRADFGSHFPGPSVTLEGVTFAAPHVLPAAVQYEPIARAAEHVPHGDRLLTELHPAIVASRRTTHSRLGDYFPVTLALRNALAGRRQG